METLSPEENIAILFAMSGRGDYDTMVQLTTLIEEVKAAAHAAGRAEGRAEALDFAASAFEATGETFSATRLRQMKP